MEKKYWFKRRRYGYGWIPVTRQGWAVIIVYLIVVLASTFILRDVPDNTYQAEVGYFLLVVLLASIVAIRISYLKGPPPKWRWGKKPDDNPDEDF